MFNNSSSKYFEVGDVVTVIAPETPRGHWPLERILEVFKGRDGHVRVVNVRVGKTVMRRPITNSNTVTYKFAI